MFTYIKLKNFISFKETVFDFRDNNYKAKNFISIYGENGSGKSNFRACPNISETSQFSPNLR